MFTSQETRKQRRKEPGQAVTPLGLPLMPYLQQPSSDSSKFHHLSKQLQQLGNKNSEIQTRAVVERGPGFKSLFYLLARPSVSSPCLFKPPL